LFSAAAAAFVLPCCQTCQFRQNLPDPYQQGDQLGRIFARWVIVYFGQFFI
jgi:hypothetical protein